MSIKDVLIHTFKKIWGSSRNLNRHKLMTHMAKMEVNNSFDSRQRRLSQIWDMPQISSRSINSSTTFIYTYVKEFVNLCSIIIIYSKVIGTVVCYQYAGPSTESSRGTSPKPGRKSKSSRSMAASSLSKNASASSSNDAPRGLV